MEIGLRARVLAENQRRTLDELTSDLDLMEDLSAHLPATIDIVVERSVGERIEAGTTT
jgi:hypothetical protein